MMGKGSDGYYMASPYHSVTLPSIQDTLALIVFVQQELLGQFLSQYSPVVILGTCFLKFSFNIILFLSLGLKWSPSMKFSNQNFVMSCFPHEYYVLHLVQPY
jgi:hypothetical protein